ncbi:uncharacterized protein LOC143883897 [Tasmannia lanceolata]|uniref:uncharacterized protein LOC143883897 n=1 Tax=Tasmannia lanceolata TaxID=3420 RepID=UPI004063ED0C
MVRFSCFPTPIHYYKSKKSVQRSAEAMHKNSQDSFHNSTPNASSSTSSSNPLNSKASNSNPSNTSVDQITGSSFECCWKSGEMNSNFSPDVEVVQTTLLKKSQSLGSGLDMERSICCDLDMEDETDPGLSYNDSYEQNFNRILGALHHNGLQEPFDHKDPGINLVNGSPETMVAESFCINDDLVRDEPIFSIGDPKQLEREVHGDSDTQLSREHFVNSGHHTPGAAPIIVISCSLPNLRVSTASSVEGSPAHRFRGARSRSVKDLNTVVTRTEYLRNEDGLHSGISFYKSKSASSFHNLSQTSHLLRKGLLHQGVSREGSVLSDLSGGSYEMTYQERDNTFEIEKHDCENQFSDGYDSGNLSLLGKDCIAPEIVEVDVGKNLQPEMPVQRWDELPSKEFNISRIDEWVSKIDLQSSSPLQELGECSSSSKKKKDPNVVNSVTTAKFDARIIPGMEMANNYIASLTAMSSSAQMANLGLVVIPFLSAFVSLRVLNLSGNAIVRITAGALPRGLHALNLSKNNFSTIEGLRELSRLRVLDLSYNRIFRIGHGLASCSSLKELYLAGNKISDVEGLHRLLKLNVLDLRFNKISTTKCLGQLAANYSSLQAINLEGNPAQRNVGDEPLKKYLLGLLPNLVYFNRQAIRSSSSKEVTDRPARSITTYNQFDRGVRSEHKLGRRGIHSTTAPKSLSSSNHGRLNQAVGSPKRSKSRHGRLPPIGGSKEAHQQLNTGNRLLSLQSTHAMRRSRSEGTL